MAFVLSPEPPLSDWIAELDAQIARSATFFAGRPIVVDLSAVPESDPGLPTLFQEMQARGIRVIGAEGADGLTPAAQSVGGPLIGGRPGGLYEVPVDPPDAPPPPEPTSLILDEPVRSGQTIVFPKGDVIINGTVAWGAEIMAGGSIHVYGALRGRAIAGVNGTPQSRIFCQKLEAELISIDGLYMTADDMEAFRGRSVQARLDGESIIITELS
jgi:septum site-determining protein MinC|nr:MULTISPECIES: septum site-determining protein MinC [unclassified Acidisoma]